MSSSCSFNQDDRAGEPLLDFPPPTRNKSGENGLPYWRTIGDFSKEIHDLPRGPLHQPDKKGRLDQPALNPHNQYRTVCTGEKVLHPSGKRFLTCHELAILQGFPRDYKWDDPQVKEREVRRQIGNAIPPVVHCHFDVHIRKHLEKLDAERAADEVDY